MNEYPLESLFNDKIKAGLLTHFAESENDDDESAIGDIDEIQRIFSDVKEYNSFLIGAYFESTEINDSKVQQINLFDESSYKLNKVTTDDERDFLEVEEEADYLSLVKCVFNEPDDVLVRVSNYSGDKEQLLSHISLLAENWNACTDISLVQQLEKKSSFEHRDDYTKILKTYWGHEEFRDFSVYDLSKLEKGEKETYKISQEQVVSDLVTQVENCMDPEKEFRDVFVTAPTGAGKSAMFQIPAIYLAEQYNLLTIVISPLIGLMNDQVKGLEVKNYSAAKTINSDISPIVKEEIISKVANEEYHILYISPETLLARSDVEQLIGNRTIGMIVIDEAHIVTTWGKQFRPDYWYLGDHIRKLRKRQRESSDKKQSFVIATFTATAIYKGVEDMYEETKNSLHLSNPITYLGYVKRDDIEICIKKKEKRKDARAEYEMDKYEDIVSLIKREKITGKKTLIYFPTVKLIERCMEYLVSSHVAGDVTYYYGPLPKDKKTEAYESFLSGEKKVMLATKAFGMGIDIDDIEIVAHFAPTGNVCDYVQEIGRAARRPDLTGEAVYTFDNRDFKYINRLYGLSTIKKYQLIEVVKKIDELYQLHLKEYHQRTKKRNAILVDAENFSYIFANPMGDDDGNTINKVKTALLIIQKDFERWNSFSPINVRPIPLFAYGYFAIQPSVQQALITRYHDVLEEKYAPEHICLVKLDKIWKMDFQNYSFPQFKYLIYKRDDDEFNSKFSFTLFPALSVSIEFSSDYQARYRNIISSLSKVVHDSAMDMKFVAAEHICTILVEKSNNTINKYKAQAIVDVFIASIDVYRKNFARTPSSLMSARNLQNGQIKYQFNEAMNTYFAWLTKGFEYIQTETKNGELYIVNNNGNETKRFNTILGILEAMDVLKFEMLGGANSQLYIYINQIRHLKNIINSPGRYRNQLLDMVGERHLISVKMLTYLYENDFSSDQIWNLLEDYFLGKIPEKVKTECHKENPNIIFPD